MITKMSKNSRVPSCSRLPNASRSISAFVGP
jgi:hypothetical protein